MGGKYAGIHMDNYCVTSSWPSGLFGLCDLEDDMDLVRIPS